MHLIITIILGLVIGLVARFLMPGPNPAGFIVTALLGIAGAVVAKWVGQAFGWYDETQGVGFIAAVLGAMLILFVYHMAMGRRA